MKKHLLWTMMSLFIFNQFVYASCEDHYKRRLYVDRRLKAIAGGVGYSAVFVGGMTVNPFVMGAGALVTVLGMKDFKEMPVPMEKLALIYSASLPAEKTDIKGSTGVSIGGGSDMTYSYSLSPEDKDVTLTSYLAVVKKQWIENSSCQGKSSVNLTLDILRKAIVNLNESEAFCPEKKWSLKKIAPKKSITRRKFLNQISAEACSILNGKYNEEKLAKEESDQEALAVKEEFQDEVTLQEQATKDEAQADGERHFLEKEKVIPMEGAPKPQSSQQ
jgi:hypothetical protein